MFMLCMVFFCVDLFMFLEILRPFECFVTYLETPSNRVRPRKGKRDTHLTYVGLERSVHAKMAGYVITLGAGSAAILPFASEAKIVGALPANVIVAQMSVKSLRIGIIKLAVNPLALVCELGVRRGRVAGLLGRC